jgi:hypothetical protein
MAEAIGPDFYRERFADPDDADETSTRDLIDTNDPAFVHIMWSCMTLSQTYGLDLADPVIVRAGIRAGRERHQNLIQVKREADEQERVRARSSVVYYMRIGNRVKIGYTTDLATRLADIGPEELLVTEPGGREVERERHNQFAALRSHREWFRWEEPLVSHVCGLQ